MRKGITMDEEKVTRKLMSIRLTDDEWKAMRYVMRLYKWGAYCPLDYTGTMGGKKEIRVLRVYEPEKVMVKTLSKAWRAGMSDAQIREILANEGIQLPEMG